MVRSGWRVVEAHEPGHGKSLLHPKSNNGIHQHILGWPKRSLGFFCEMVPNTEQPFWLTRYFNHISFERDLVKWRLDPFSLAVSLPFPGSSEPATLS